MDRSPQTLVKFAFPLLSFALFEQLAVTRLHSDHSASFDLALYVRHLWGLWHGELVNPLRGQHWLALHAEWLLWPIAPLAAVFPPADLLVTLQSAALAWTAHLIGREAGVATGLAFVLMPATSQLADFDFHPVSLALPFLVLGIRRPAWLILAVLCREELAWVAAIMLALKRQTRAWAVLPALYFAGYWLFLRPMFQPDAQAIDPHIAGPLSFDSSHLWFLCKLLLPLGLLSLGDWRLLSPAMFALGFCLLSSFPGARDISRSHYFASALPFLALAAGQVARRVHADRWLAIAAFVGHLAWGATPLSFAYRATEHQDTPRSVAGRQLLSDIPQDTGLAVPFPVASRLAWRRDITIAPQVTEQTQFVLADLETPWKPKLARAMNAKVRALSWQGPFGLRARAGPLVLLQRGYSKSAWCRREYGAPDVERSEVLVRWADGLVLREGSILQAERNLLRDGLLRLSSGNQVDACDGFYPLILWKAGDAFVVPVPLDETIEIVDPASGKLWAKGSAEN